jgi:hypothetical protein
MAHPPTRPPAPKRRPFTNGTPAPVGTPRRVGTPAGPSTYGAAVYTPGHYMHEGYGGVAELDDYARGGVVPGPRGKPQLAVVHGGERITPVNQSAPNREGETDDEVAFRKEVYARILQSLWERTAKDNLEVYPIDQYHELIGSGELQTAVDFFMDYFPATGLTPDYITRTGVLRAYFPLASDSDITNLAKYRDMKKYPLLHGFYARHTNEDALAAVRAEIKKAKAGVKKLKDMSDQEKLWEDYIGHANITENQRVYYDSDEVRERVIDWWIKDTMDASDRGDTALGGMPFFQFLNQHIAPLVNLGKTIPTAEQRERVASFEQYLARKGLFPDLTNPTVAENWDKWMKKISGPMDSMLSTLPEGADSQDTFDIYDQWIDQMPTPDWFSSPQLTATERFTSLARDAGFSDQAIQAALSKETPTSDEGFLLKDAYSKAANKFLIAEDMGDEPNWDDYINTELDAMPDMDEVNRQQQAFFGSQPPQMPGIPSDFVPDYSRAVTDPDTGEPVIDPDTGQPKRVGSFKVWDRKTGELREATDEEKQEHFAVLAGYRDTRLKEIDPTDAYPRTKETGEAGGTSAHQKWLAAQEAVPTVEDKTDYDERLSVGAQKFMDEYNARTRQDYDAEPITLEQATTMIRDELSVAAGIESADPGTTGRRPLFDRYVPKQKQPTLTRAQVTALPGSQEMFAAGPGPSSPMSGPSSPLARGMWSAPFDWEDEGAQPKKEKKTPLTAKLTKYTGVMK